MLKIQDIPHKFISIRACFVFKNDESKYWVLQNRKTLGLPNLPGWGALVSKNRNQVEAWESDKSSPCYVEWTFWEHSLIKLIQDQKCLHAIVFKFLVGVFKKENLHWYSYKWVSSALVQSRESFLGRWEWLALSTRRRNLHMTRKACGSLFYSEFWKTSTQLPENRKT